MNDSKRPQIRYLFFLFFGITLATLAFSATIPSVFIRAKKRHYFSMHPASSRITHDQIVQSGAASLPQVLQTLGGLQLQDLNGSGGQPAISMRGFGANAASNTLLLINGLPITYPDIAPPDLSIIPLQEIRYIEVIEGSESVSYGDQAVGGAINIVARQPDKEEILAGCGAGSYAQKSCSISAHYQPHSLFNLGFTLLGQETDNYRQHNHHQQSGLYGNAAYSRVADHFYGDYHLARDDIQYPGSLTAAEVRQDRQQASNNIDFFRNGNAHAHIRYIHQGEAPWQLETDAALFKMRGQGVLFSSFRQSRDTGYIRSQVRSQMDRYALLTGAELQLDDYRLGSLMGLVENTQQKSGLFAEVTTALWPKTQLMFGVRGEQQDSRLHAMSNSHSHQRVIVKNVGIVYQWMPQLGLYARYAESFRFPKADETASLASGVGGLQVQQGASYEMGVKWHQKHYRGQLAIYQLNLKNEIAFDPTQTPLQPFGTNRNLDLTTRQGMTFSGSVPLTALLMANGQYNYVDARFRRGIYAGNRIPLIAEHNLRGGLYYQLTSFLHIYSEAVYTGNQYADNDNANIAGKMGGYMVYNFNLGFQRKHMSAAFRINNIFNRGYYFYTVYNTSLQNESFYPAPERNFTLSLQYSF